jgi:molybdopterin converting factor small subunit
MVEAKSYRREARGEPPLNVEAEVARLLADSSAGLGHDAELREEVRQLVVARNERRMRRGEAPLDVGDEVERQLRELENLGQ